ncbi:hypothetical protein TTHERM_00460730 (macronuclear) [Tetrahymena thermophila SB210]|uniref:Uncharacterized protein n=1 Tax=Tetrahymena thermophila (strain SB210) TaxID=312017 RepID=Q23Q11_TETTS|nr:hypothetical protein TTHERM_00460730 [Tetrahymena thermophila SB210]EAR98524.2 hypothetical protein TTHERM_00460730 [Tetrahymena thermophila SB210]|eukprot:XP_001018769.2 hypothetical protein TTHERM_00460730 [Tetrahymena thermophila SB210]
MDILTVNCLIRKSFPEFFEQINQLKIRSKYLLSKRNKPKQLKIFRAYQRNKTQVKVWSKAKKTHLNKQVSQNKQSEMNTFSEQKNRRFEQGFLGDKSYEISMHNLKSPTLKLSFDMHHLSLNKQSNYLGLRNQKYFNSNLTLKDDNSGRKIRAHITPYSQSNYDFQISQLLKSTKKFETKILANLTKKCDELSKDHYKDYSLGGQIKSNSFYNKILCNYDEKSGIGLEFSVRFFNYNRYNIKLNSSSKQEVQNEQENQQQSEHSSNQNNQISLLQSASNVQNVEKPFKFEFSFHFKTKSDLDKFQYSIFTDLLFKKYEAMISANFQGKSLKEVLCLLRYNSSLWLKLVSGNNDPNNYNQGGVELVYQHDFNKFIHLKNYINSNYTIATQLSYNPSDFVSLIYSATINIQKFKQDSEDYKVGYGIHFNF